LWEGIGAQWSGPFEGPSRRTYSFPEINTKKEWFSPPSPVECCDLIMVETSFKALMQKIF
jgi:hypothetical protein